MKQITHILLKYRYLYKFYILLIIVNWELRPIKWETGLHKETINQSYERNRVNCVMEKINQER